MSKPKGVSTERFVEIEEIRGPIVILKDGSLRVIVEAMSVNFELKSEDEKSFSIDSTDHQLPLDYNILLKSNMGKMDLVPKIIQKFFWQTNSDIDQLAQAITARDVRNIVAIAHRLKGSAATVNAHTIRNYAEVLEGIGRNGELDRAQAFFQNIQKEFARFRAYVLDMGIIKI